MEQVLRSNPTPDPCHGPIAINYHVSRKCNARCRFCFATFRDVDGQLTTKESAQLIDALRKAGGEKLTFAGGEPTLLPDLGILLAHARSIGFVTGIVTNGARLPAVLDRNHQDLDWVGLSVDSGNESTLVELGRSRGDHVARSIAHASMCREAGVRVKLNTVVTSLNWREDLGTLVRAVKPSRWKVFQVLPIHGQNDGDVSDLLISPAQFTAFIARHGGLACEGFAPVAEDNDAMVGSYVMVDPLGRFFSNFHGCHQYSSPIRHVGVEAAWAEVGFDSEKFLRRGGRYEW